MKKSNKFIALVLSLVMAMSFTVIGNAETQEGYTDGNTPVPMESIDLLPASYGVGPTLTVAQVSASAVFTYNSQVTCHLSLQPYKTSEHDKNKSNGTYTIQIKEGSGSYGASAEFKDDTVIPINAHTTYYFKVTRKYSSPVTNPFVGVTAKISPEVISAGYKRPLAGDKDISTYYSFTPDTDGGYLFNLEPATGCVGTNKHYQVDVYSKIGSSVNEFATYEKGKTKSMLRLYLKAKTEYIVEVKGYGDTDLGYTFSLDSVPVGPGIALVGAPALSVGNETTCTLYPFANRRAFAWYSFTAPKDGGYEFVVNNKYDVNLTGDIIAEIRDENFSPTEDDDILYLYENESGVLTKNMKEGEVCYIQVAEQFKGGLADVYNVGLKVREHQHTKEIFVDGDYVCYGCPCQLQEYMDYAFWLLDARAANATYTGKNVTPKAKFDISESYCKEGCSISIPNSAYTITVTSKNKKSVGSAKAKIKFTGIYKGLGSFTHSFKIVPKGTTVSSVKSAKAGFTAKWKKQATQTTGYELRYATNSYMTGAKTVAIKSNKTLSKKIGKLKSGTNYYVQVRTYKTVSGKKYCSSWSAKKEVTTK